MVPYATGDTDVEVVKVQPICIVPHTLGSVFLHHEAVTWQVYFKIMYPAITTEGKEIDTHC